MLSLKEKVMVNEIKFDGVTNLPAMKVTKKLEAGSKINPETNEDELAVNLSSLSNIMLAETSPQEQARMVEVKQLIENKNYPIHLDLLTNKLAPYFLKKIG